MNPKIQVIFGLLLVVSGVAWLSWQTSDYVWIPSCTGNGGRWGPRLYYDGERIPNGWYLVSCIEESKNGEVFFPLCPNSPGRLHGTWKCTVFLEADFYGDVRVENSIIVEKEIIVT